MASLPRPLSLQALRDRGQRSFVAPFARKVHNTRAHDPTSECRPLCSRSPCGIISLSAAQPRAYRGRTQCSAADPIAASFEDPKAQNAERQHGEVTGAIPKSLGERLKSAGIAGVLSYGILNTCYYLGAFLFVFLKVSPLQRGAGFTEAGRHCAMLLALVWGGSQVTKIPRMLCALAMTPWIDGMLHWLTSNNKVESKSKALALAAFACFGAAAIVFGGLILLWA